MEVVLKTYSKMEQSWMKFESVNVATVGSEQISLCNLVDKAEYERVMLKAQVIKIDDQETVGGNKKK